MRRMRRDEQDDEESRMMNEAEGRRGRGREEGPNKDQKREDTEGVSPPPLAADCLTEGDLCAESLTLRRPGPGAEDEEPPASPPGARRAATTTCALQGAEVGGRDVAGRPGRHRTEWRVATRLLAAPLRRCGESRRAGRNTRAPDASCRWRPARGTPIGHNARGRRPRPLPRRRRGWRRAWIGGRDGARPTSHKAQEDDQRCHVTLRVLCCHIRRRQWPSPSHGSVNNTCTCVCVCVGLRKMGAGIRKHGKKHAACQARSIRLARHSASKTSSKCREKETEKEKRTGRGGRVEGRQTKSRPDDDKAHKCRRNASGRGRLWRTKSRSRPWPAGLPTLPAVCPRSAAATKCSKCLASPAPAVPHLSVLAQKLVAPWASLRLVNYNLVALMGRMCQFSHPGPLGSASLS